MNHFLLDTSALLTLRNNEAGAEVVADILYQSQKNKVACFACFMTQMELFYRVWKDEDELAGRLAYAQCQELPIIWMHENPTLLEKAAELKATYDISLADAWIAAAALIQDAILIHKDPEFELINCRQQPLPYKQ